MNSYWNPQRGDNFTTATSIGIESARQAGYFFVRTEGYVYPDYRKGTVPLSLYWNPQREDNFTTATSVGVESARQAGYYHVRDEGFAYPVHACR